MPTPRLPYRSRDELAPPDQPLLERPIHIFGALAHSPAGLRAFTAFGEWLRHGSSVDPHLRELAILEVAVTRGNDYVFSHHVKIGAEFGVTPQDIARVVGWTPPADGVPMSLQDAVLSAARELAGPAGRLSETTWETLAAQLTPQALVDLVLVIGYYTMNVLCADALGVQVEPAYEPFLVVEGDARPSSSAPPDPSRDELLRMLEAPPNWGRWGQDDERGTINLIGPDKRREAAALVRTGTTVTLSRPFPTAPGPGNPRPATQALMRERKPLGGGAALEYLGLSMHGVSCTHLDALCHNWGAAGMWGGRDPNEMLTPDGSDWGDIEQWRDGILTRGVLLDIPALREVPYVTMDRPVLGSELDAAAARQGVAVGPGDAVIVYCGREAWDAEQVAWGNGEGRPGLHASCLGFLARHDVAVLAWDMMDALPDTEQLPWSVHGALYALGLALLDNCALGELVQVCRAERRSEFMFVAAPLRVARGTGSPVNPLAVL